MFKNAREFGAAMKWGRGEAEALARASKVTREDLELIDVTVEIAQRWAEAYEEEYELNSANGSAKGRIILMRRAAELLRDTR